ncbi:AI-2E family transporter [Rhodohalobacter sp. 614A]|uniref:AI-2E family transporter n=1 Tax=Rhodohalobacter sp. 614A TaxID=2908649 RepID=UPI001F2F9445|nr:AI-2E family transporter [Rhodohalobacter sp. 614A]
MVDKTNPESDSEENSTYSFIKKVLISVVVAATITLLVLFVGYAVNILLLVFLGVLLGIVFRSLRDIISDYTGMPTTLSLAVVVVFLFGLFIGSGYLLVPKIYQQAEMMYDQAPEEWNKIKQKLWQYEWGKEIARENPNPKDFLENEQGTAGEDNDMTQGVLDLFTVTAGAIASTVLVIVIAIYIAAEPEVYTSGFLRLFPTDKRLLVTNIMDETALTIQWWLVGQLVSMLILGIITTLGLWLLGMPYSLVLGIFTALMTFIPNLGPILAGIPTLLVALTQSPTMVLYVGIFYIFIQSVEGYFITPMIHREAINVPPVLIITIQFLLYYLIGFIGVFVAMPLVACLMILIQRVYIEEILGDSMDREVDIEYKGKTIV